MKESINQKALELIQTYTNVFTSPGGKRVFRDLQRAFGGSCFNENPFVMAKMEGSREVLLKIEGMIRKSKNKLLIEQLSKQEEEED